VAQRLSPQHPSEPSGGPQQAVSQSAGELADLDTVAEQQERVADPEEFDQTFTAGRGNFNIGGAISSPASFPLQALPRLAYVINYNVVYDEDQDKWVPQKKSEPQDDENEVIIIGDGDGFLGVLITGHTASVSLIRGVQDTIKASSPGKATSRLTVV